MRSQKLIKTGRIFGLKKENFPSPQKYRVMKKQGNKVSQVRVSFEEINVGPWASLNIVSSSKNHFQHVRIIEKIPAFYLKSFKGLQTFSYHPVDAYVDPKCLHRKS